MDNATLLAALDFTRARLMGSLEAMEKSGQPLDQILAWRPGPGRAHTAWQALHCAATHDKYFNVYVLKSAVKDDALVTAYGGGSTPSDTNIPGLAYIKDKLAAAYQPLRDWVATANPEQLAVMVKRPNGQEMSVGNSVILLTWHEAHHQGQIHLTWNLYKAAHGMEK